jgi:hypothetical protein
MFCYVVGYSLGYYAPAVSYGEPWGNRTLNLLIKSQLLYQLS